MQFNNLTKLLTLEIYFVWIWSSLQSDVCVESNELDVPGRVSKTEHVAFKTGKRFFFCLEAHIVKPSQKPLSVNFKLQWCSKPSDTSTLAASC
jgi:hypothetical protein